MQYAVAWIVGLTCAHISLRKLRFRNLVSNGLGASEAPSRSYIPSLVPRRNEANIYRAQRMYDTVTSQRRADLWNVLNRHKIGLRLDYELSVIRWLGLGCVSSVAK